MLTYRFDRRWDDIVRSLFGTDDNGCLTFGFASARTLEPASPSDLRSSFLRLRDYVMEGFVFYSLRLHESEHGCTLEVKTDDSLRSVHVASALKQYFKSAGVAPTGEATTPNKAGRGNGGQPFRLGSHDET